MFIKIRKPKLYKTIVADPPWRERGGGRIRRGADRHYPLLSTEEILRVMLTSSGWRPDPNGCHLYLWVTNNFLPDGLAVMRFLGFTYKTNLCWAKDRFGIGRYFRGQHELALFGTMGLYMATGANNISTVINASRGKHSQKPEEFMAMVERASPEPRLEMFARSERVGWDHWGDEL